MVTPPSSPVISLGLPVYNGEIYLKRAVDSILKQSCTDFELMISDKGSTDKTQAICEGYAKIDSRVRCFRYEENKGAPWVYQSLQIR